MAKFSQLIKNGTLETGDSWTKVSSTVSDGVITLNVVSGAASRVTQSLNLVDGSKYKITAIVNGVSGNEIKFRDYFNDTGGLPSADGKVTLTGVDQQVELIWTANSVSNSIRIDRVTSSGTYSVTIKNLIVTKLSPFNDIIKPADVPTPIFNDIIRTFAGEEPWHLK
jgi:hypothetical protein